MTDPKELATLLRDQAERGFSFSPELREAAAHLNAYARILAADTNTREIEERHARDQQHIDNSLACNTPASKVNVRKTDTDAHRDRATLLDVVRRLRLVAADLDAKVFGIQGNIDAITSETSRMLDAANARAERLTDGINVYRSFVRALVELGTGKNVELVPLKVVTEWERAHGSEVNKKASP